MDFDRMLSYCGALDKNNERTWFHENHKWYEDAKADFFSLVEMTRFAIIAAAPDLSDDLMFGRAKDWAYRIPRDMRIKNGKPPYNPAFRAYISRDKKSPLPVGYYMHIAPGVSHFGTGIWYAETAECNTVRAYIAAHAYEFIDLVLRSGVEISGEKLKKMPRGYSEDMPAADFIKHKTWLVCEDIEDSELTTFEAFDELVRDKVSRMEPLRQFLLRAAQAPKTQKQAIEEFFTE